MLATIHKVDPSLFQLQFDSRSRLASFCCISQQQELCLNLADVD